MFIQSRPANQSVLTVKVTDFVYQLANCPVHMRTHNGALSSRPSLTYITPLGNACPHFEAWELARLDICLYKRCFVLCEEECACCGSAFSDAAQGIRRDEAREVLTLYSRMNADTVRDSGHNGTLFQQSRRNA